MDYFTVLILMILIHVIADFHLQGIMAQMKQKSWWTEQIERAPEKDRKEMREMYGHDHVPVLLLHGFEWTILVSLPILYLSDWTLPPIMWFFLFCMVAYHALFDHMKCNLDCINLVQDQFLHMLQIVGIWVIWMNIQGAIF